MARASGLTLRAAVCVISCVFGAGGAVRADEAAPRSWVAQRAERALPGLLWQLQSARQAQAFERADCIDRAITQLHAAWRRAQEHERALALHPSDAHHRAVLRRLNERVRALQNEGLACAQPQGALASGEFVVEAWIPAPPASARDDVAR